MWRIPQPQSRTIASTPCGEDLQRDGEGTRLAAVIGVEHDVIARLADYRLEAVQELAVEPEDIGDPHERASYEDERFWPASAPRRLTSAAKLDY